MGQARLSSCEPRLDPDAETPLSRALLESFRGPLRRYAGLRVELLALGRRFLLVRAEGRALGLSYAPLEEPVPSALLGASTLEELARYAWQHPVATAAALAAANAATAALIDGGGGWWLSRGGDVAEALGAGRDSEIAMVGYVPGVARRLRERGARVTVYEDNVAHRRQAEREGYETRPGVQLLLEAGRYDAVVATGASLLEPRLHAALELAAASGSRPRLALVGPTSSFHPSIAADLGADLVAGSYVPPEARGTVERLVLAGYGFRVIKRYVEKWLARAPEGLRR